MKLRLRSGFLGHITILTIVFSQAANFSHVANAVSAKAYLQWYYRVCNNLTDASEFSIKDQSNQIIIVNIKAEKIEKILLSAVVNNVSELNFMFGDSEANKVVADNKVT